MPKIGQITVLPDENTTTSGSKANRAALSEMFAKPYGDGTDYNHSNIKEKYQELLDGEIESPYFGTVKLNYSENNPPDYADVDTGPGGLPASAWVPNPASPGEGNGLNAAEMPKPPDDYGTQEPATWGVGSGSQLSPAASSKQIEALSIVEGLPERRSSHG